MYKKCSQKKQQKQDEQQASSSQPKESRPKDKYMDILTEIRDLLKVMENGATDDIIIKDEDGNTPLYESERGTKYYMNWNGRHDRQAPRWHEVAV